MENKESCQIKVNEKGQYVMPLSRVVFYPELTIVPTVAVHCGKSTVELLITKRQEINDKVIFTGVNSGGEEMKLSGETEVAVVSVSIKRGKL